MFFRVQQIPLTSSNDQDRDGIPDGWELQHGLDPLNPNDAAQIVPGDSQSWWELYEYPIVATQAFRVVAVSVTNAFLRMAFPGRSDSYYILHSSSPLKAAFAPTNALLGSDRMLHFQQAVVASPAFFRVQRIPLASTNSLLTDGIPDGWKLQHGLSVFGPSVANQVPLGDTRTWLQISKDDITLSMLPAAYFLQSSNTVIAGSSNVTLQVAFTKPFTGLLKYQVSGSAVPTTASAVGDYTSPSGFVNVVNTTNALFTINLIPHPAVEAIRTLVIGLSTSNPPTALLNPGNYNSFYTLLTNASVCEVPIIQSSLGAFVGSLTITNGLPLVTQPIKMALRPAVGGTVAFFDATGSTLLPGTFAVPATADSQSFSLNSGFSQQITNTVIGRPLTVALSFKATQSDPAGGLFTIPVTVTLTGLTASGKSYVGSGTLTLSRVQ